MRGWAATLAVTASLAAAGAAMAQVQPPAPGASPRIDAIRKAGALRVGVLANAPWLVENTTGQGEAWSGAAWTLAKEYARLLNVTLQPVLVSHETKVPVLAANQVDMSITPLAETPERLQVVDFVLYSKTSVCMFGLAANPKFAAAATVDDLNSPDITIAYYTGGAEENWVKGASTRSCMSRLRHRAGRDQQRAGGRSTASRGSRWRPSEGSAALPKEKNCQGSSREGEPGGLAVDKSQTAYVEWLRAVANSIAPQLEADEQKVVATMQ
jgi:polar amino acid transport system substrate-binding protein